MSIALRISGTPRVTGLDGLFFMDDPSATGNDRMWRNKGSGRVYYDNGWKIADALTTTIYFSEDPEPVSDGGTPVWAENPWEIIASNWRPSVEEYADFRPVITTAEDTAEEETTETTTVPYYELTTDEKFNTITTYYYLDSDLNKYVRIPVVVAGNKIDTDVYYSEDVNPYGVVTGYSFTTDPYFLSDHAYFVKINDKYYQIPFANDVVPYGKYFVETGIQTTTTTTIVNKRTGETRTSTNTVFTKNEIIPDMHKRYFVPNLEVGQIYRFSFVKDFKYMGYMDPSTEDYKGLDGENDADITRGVYKITNQMTYYKLLLSGIDVYQNLYLPLKIPYTVYETDRKTWMNDDIWYELTDPSIPSRVFYVPLGIINGIPDANVHEYDRYQLIIDIGVFQDPEFLAEVITDLNLLMKAKFGMPTTAKLASYDKVYIPDEYYNWLESERKDNITKFMSEHGDQFYKALFYDKFNNLYRECLELKQKNKSYEEIIAQLAAGGNQ